MSPRQTWVPVVAYGGTVLVGTTTVAVSGLWLTHLAQLIGMRGLLAVSLPVTVDAGGAVGTVLWLTGPSKDARKWGRGVALGALSGSILGNVLAHLIELGMLAVSAPLVVAVSAVYPVMCWLMVHLVVLLRAPGRIPARKPAAKPAQKSTPAPSPPTPPAEPATEEQTVALHVVDPPTTSKREQARGWFHGQVGQGRDPDDIRPAEVDKAIGSQGYAKKFIADWRAEATTPSPATDVAVNE